MDSGLQDDSCEFSCSFMFMPDEDDDSSDFLMAQNNQSSVVDHIKISDDLAIDVTQEKLQEILLNSERVTSQFSIDAPSCSKALSVGDQARLQISDGFSLTISSDQYQKLVKTMKKTSDDENESEGKKLIADTDSEDDDGSDEEDKKKANKKKGESENEKTKSSKGNKRKSKKGSDVSNKTSSETIEEKKPKKKRQRTKTPKRKDEKEDSEEDDSSDEEIKKINQAAAKIPTYKSIKNLVKNQYYKVLDLVEVETSKGKTIRLRLEDHDVEDKWCYVHMPRNDTSKSETRRRWAERQRIRRKKLDKLAHEKYRIKAQQRMRRVRSRKSASQKKLEKQLNRERRFKARLMKKSGMIFNSEIVDVDQFNFECYLKSLTWVECCQCQKRVLHSSLKNFTCTKNCSLFTEENDMDPFQIPDELKDLTYIEKQLISRVHPVISLYRVKKLEYKYKGQVINFTQDVQHVADKLPHLVADLRNVVVVRLDQQSTLKDFVVRKDKVLNALLWLQKNNPHYADVTIDYSVIHTLPNDGNVYDDISLTLNGDDTETEKDFDTEHAVSDSDDIDDGNDDIVYTSVPDNDHSTITKSFSNDLVWPSIGKVPLNEFSSPGYMSMAFPHLFCYGTCDFSMPKKKKVSLTDYVRHLMQYKDQRFAKDERFRYFIMNSEMRWQSLNIGNVYVRKNSEFSKMTILQLKEHFKENPWIVNQIMHFGSRLRSTKSYWNSRCSELLDMVNQIGTPTIFFTLSSADYYWPDLYRLLGHKVSDLSLQQRAQLLSENPLVADSFFYLRSKFFLESAFKKHFDVQDMWFRYEFQHRGSIHLHGVAWFKGAPKVSDDMTESEKLIVLKYFDNLISCQNPDIHKLPLNPHPCEISIGSIESQEDDLCNLINRVQRHTKCSVNHCLRPTGKSKDLQCRYKFPKELISETQFEIKDDKVADINFKRNDVYVNKFNPWVLQTWRSNIDFSPILSKQIVYRYIAKYASKSEVKSVNYNEVLTDILKKSSDDSEKAKKAIRKLLISSCAERDYSSQEVMHFVMGYHFYHSSREFVVINLKNIEWTAVSQSFNLRNIFDVYKHRPLQYEKLSIYEFAKYIKVVKGDYIVRTVPAVVRFFPRAQYGVDNDSFIQHLTYLFYPWRHSDDLSYVNDEIEFFVKAAYHKYVTHLNIDELSDNDDNDFHDSETFREKDNETILSQYNPNTSKGQEVGFNFEDVKMKWDYLSRKLNAGTINVISEKLQTDVNEQVHLKLNYGSLNKHQRMVFEHIKSLTCKVQEGLVMTSTFTIVQGMAGSGKTYLLQCCAQFIRSVLGNQSVKVAAPTGVAAKIVNGSTIHSLLSLGRFNYKLQRLSGIELLHFKEKHVGLKFLFIDEYSMVGLRMLACIEYRCRDLSGNEDLFGNMHIVLFGDANQLLPVGDQPLFADIYNLPNSNSLLERGKIIINELTHAYVLKGCHRFANASYVSFLKRVANGTCNVTDFDVMKTRFVNSLSTSEKQNFCNTIRICATNESAYDYNIDKLKNLKKPVAVINAQNNNKTAFSSSDDLADGLLNVLSISIESKVMLRRNLNVSRGLVNGAIGVVKHIFYEHGKRPPSLPVCILVLFENVNVSDLGINLVPITPVQCQWYKNGIACSRFQLPLNLCWACTIHKAQGLSLPQIVLDAGSHEFALGLLYVALSRVPDVQSLCLVTFLTLERLNASSSSSRFGMRKMFLKKLKRMCKF
ncbi:ATP-dependent DNA helicase [Frankliniella fusca]|uniref:ATP-dependent DNA helicase n=1 Tax=Frankliniella fusca TaxID=407009 RepID=A0AAE1LA34_9NEOP|nr:ATP-dependent DNA helicase [Frankliniella fusca]